LDAGEADATTPNDAPSSGVGQISGVVDDWTGAPASGVTVTSGTTTATTASDGSYSLAGVPAGSAVLTYAKTGYLPTGQSVTVAAGQTAMQNAILIPMVTPQPLSADSGGTVHGLRGSTMTAQPAAFVDATGTAVTGMVDVFLRPLDPAITQERNALPGALTGSTMGGTTGPLSPYGTLEVTVQQNGAALQVAQGKTLTITFPATAAGGAAKSTTLWSFEPQTATWLEEGTATLSGGFYTATLHHLCYHTASCQEMGGTCQSCGGNAMCGDGCTDTDNDPNNCGTCGHVCPDLAICVVGMCSTLCVDGQSMCDGSCVDSSSDPSNCGTCGMTCPDGEACVDGNCTPCADSGGTECDGDCTDLGTDPYNCGMCDNSCPGDQFCADGACIAMVTEPGDAGLPDTGVRDSGSGVRDTGAPPGTPTVTLSGGFTGTFGCTAMAVWAMSSDQTTIVFEAGTLPPGLQSFAATAVVSGQLSPMTYPFSSLAKWATEVEATGGNPTWETSSTETPVLGSETVTISSDTVTLNVAQAITYSVHGTFDAVAPPMSDAGPPVMVHIDY
jgi:hypothetical protein